MSKKQKSDTKTVRSPLLKILKRFLKFALLQSICTVMSAVVIFASFVDWFYEPTSWWNVKKYNFKARSKNQLGKTFEHAIKTITDATLMPISHNKVVCSLQRQMHVPSVTYRKLHDDVMRYTRQTYCDGIRSQLHELADLGSTLNYRGLFTPSCCGMCKWECFIIFFAVHSLRSLFGGFEKEWTYKLNSISFRNYKT